MSHLVDTNVLLRRQHILTFNGADFTRFTTLPPKLGPGIIVVEPKDVR